MANAHLDKLARPRIRLLNKSLPAFQVCGIAGLSLALALSMALVVYLGLLPWVMVTIVVAAVLAFLALVMLTKIITGEESITYYHHEIAVMGVAALLLSVLGQSVLPYLDVTILGIGLFLACGRVGCLMVGCCHGRPHPLGLCYNEDHAAAGFSSYYVGVRLFPVQAVESLWVFCIVVTGSVIVLRGDPAGEALTLYVVAYDIGRFCFEFMRGDVDRRYYLGFSEAQWISLLLMCAVVCAELSGILIFNPWHVTATACLVLTMIAIMTRRHLQKEPEYELYGARHLKEVAKAVGELSSRAAEATYFPDTRLILSETHLARTSLGVQISASRIERGADLINHYALSYQDKVMTKETASNLAMLILRLKHSCGSSELVDGYKGIYHLLIHSGAAGQAQSRPGSEQGLGLAGAGVRNDGLIFRQ
jgi:hypothetical protein